MEFAGGGGGGYGFQRCDIVPRSRQILPPLCFGKHCNAGLEEYGRDDNSSPHFLAFPSVLHMEKDPMQNNYFSRSMAIESVDRDAQQATGGATACHYTILDRPTCRRDEGEEEDEREGTEKYAYGLLDPSKCTCCDRTEFHDFVELAENFQALGFDVSLLVSYKQYQLKQQFPDDANHWRVEWERLGFRRVIALSPTGETTAYIATPGRDCDYRTRHITDATVQNLVSMLQWNSAIPDELETVAEYNARATITPMRYTHMCGILGGPQYELVMVHNTRLVERDGAVRSVYFNHHAWVIAALLGAFESIEFDEDDEIDEDGTTRHYMSMFGIIGRVIFFKRNVVTMELEDLSMTELREMTESVYTHTTVNSPVASILKMFFPGGVSTHEESVTASKRLVNEVFLLTQRSASSKFEQLWAELQEVCRSTNIYGRYNFDRPEYPVNPHTAVKGFLSCAIAFVLARFAAFPIQVVDALCTVYNKHYVYPLGRASCVYGHVFPHCDESYHVRRMLSGASFVPVLEGAPMVLNIGEPIMTGIEDDERHPQALDPLFPCSRHLLSDTLGNELRSSMDDGERAVSDPLEHPMPDTVSEGEEQKKKKKEQKKRHRRHRREKRISKKLTPEQVELYWKLAEENNCVVHTTKKKEKKKRPSRKRRRDDFDEEERDKQCKRRKTKEAEDDVVDAASAAAVEEEEEQEVSVREGARADPAIEQTGLSHEDSAMDIENAEVKEEEQEDEVVVMEAAAVAVTVKDENVRVKEISCVEHEEQKEEEPLKMPQVDINFDDLEDLDMDSLDEEEEEEEQADDGFEGFGDISEYVNTEFLQSVIAATSRA